jgi:hypothetical protein
MELNINTEVRHFKRLYIRSYTGVEPNYVIHNGYIHESAVSPIFDLRYTYIKLILKIYEKQN